MAYCDEPCSDCPTIGSKSCNLPGIRALWLYSYAIGMDCVCPNDAMTPAIWQAAINSLWSSRPSISSIPLGQIWIASIFPLDHYTTPPCDINSMANGCYGTPFGSTLPWGYWPDCGFGPIGFILYGGNPCTGTCSIDPSCVGPPASLNCCCGCVDPSICGSGGCYGNSEYMVYGPILHHIHRKFDM
jgi:hypothetical protein